MTGMSDSSVPYRDGKSYRESDASFVVHSPWADQSKRRGPFIETIEGTLEVGKDETKKNLRIGRESCKRFSIFLHSSCSRSGSVCGTL